MTNVEQMSIIGLRSTILIANLAAGIATIATTETQPSPTRVRSLGLLGKVHDHRGTSTTPGVEIVAFTRSIQKTKS